ncbi:glycosyltransferase family 39 protein [Thermococcus sp.]|uniref:ArnT family glycosyltransferase n=1 Tax=Thermococcus sp. TaxID=35749 RepID=UPI002603C13C|nr:glycosyltransferase family 39 protein [Thermococcus sp.]
MSRKRVLALLWATLILAPFHLLRLFQDEMLYMILSRDAWHLIMRPRSSLVFILTSPLTAIGNVDVWVTLLRLSTSFVTLANVLLVYELAKKRFGEKPAFIGALLFITSFTVLRYGARYTLEPWGVFFVLLAIYLTEKSPALAGLCIGLSFASRETWLTTIPFFLLYLRIIRKRDFWRALVTASAPVLPTFLLMAGIGIQRSPIEYNSRIFIQWGFEAVELEIRAWGLFAIAYLLITLGFLGALLFAEKRLRREIALLALPSVLTLGGVFGFLLNGPFERYTYGPLALMSIYSGWGLLRAYDWAKNHVPVIKPALKKVVALFIGLQLIAMNIAVVEMSNIGAKGIQDYGYWHDRKVFRILEEYAKSTDSFGGTPHPGLLGFENWTWADRNLTRVLLKNPDWLITFRAWAEVNQSAVHDGAVEVWETGPYLIVHRKTSLPMKNCVIPRNFTFWRKP